MKFRGTKAILLGQDGQAEFCLSFGHVKFIPDAEIGMKHGHSLMRDINGMASNHRQLTGIWKLRSDEMKPH